MRAETRLTHPTQVVPPTVNDLAIQSADATRSDAPPHREPLAAFVAFAAEVLEVSCTEADGVASLSFDHRQHPTWPKPYHVRMAVEGEALATPPRRVLPPVEGGQWLWRLAQESAGALVARPASQPEAVHEFSSRLFDAYQVDGGQTHMAGCRLVEVPFLRVTTLAEDDASQVLHQFYTAEGAATEPALVATLGLADLKPLAAQTTPPMAATVKSWVAAVDTSGERLLAVTVVIAKRAEGAVQFDIGEQCARITFDDWTTTLAAPAFRCVASGTTTYHLAAVDDGRIVAAEAIGTCDESKARVLECERVKCGVTGKRVDRRLSVACPVSGGPVLRKHTARCSACDQRVSNAVLQGGVCQACRSLKPVRPTDTLVAGLLEQYPELQQYGKFRAGEAGGQRRVLASGWWRRLMLIAPAGGGPLTSVARREGLVGSWEPVPRAQWPTVLGEPSPESS